MPTLRRLCESPGCGHLATRGSKYCTGHKAKAIARAAAMKDAADKRRPPAHKRGYDHVWKKLRAEFVRAHPYCNVPGCGQPTKEVDHIIPIAEGGARLSWGNLQSRCKSHHSQKTARENQDGRGFRRRW